MAIIPILIISHDGFAEALLRSAQMIVGEQDRVATLGLEESDGLSNFIEKVQKSAKDLKREDNLLVLVDLPGGTPWNATLAIKKPDIHIVSGANLPMLLEVLLSRERFTDVADLAKYAIESAQAGIKHIGDI